METDREKGLKAIAGLKALYHEDLELPEIEIPYRVENDISSLLNHNPKVQYLGKTNYVNVVWDLSNKIQNKIRVSNIFYNILKDRNTIINMDPIPLDLSLDRISCDAKNAYATNILDSDALKYKYFILRILEICIAKAEEEIKTEERLEKEKMEIFELNRKRESDLSKLL